MTALRSYFERFVVSACAIVVMLSAFAAVMVLVQADEGGGSDEKDERSLECDVDPQSCACNVQYCQPPPTPNVH